MEARSHKSKTIGCVTIFILPQDNKPRPVSNRRTTHHPMTAQLKPISIQLYSLRAEAAKDFPAVLRRLAGIGYKGVEPAGFFNFSPKEFRGCVEDLGMVISSTHSPWATLDNLSQSIDIYGELGIKLVAGGFGADDFATLDGIRRTAEITSKMNQILAGAGFTLVIHNHHWEFEKIDGRIKHEIFAELCPEVKFELDTYWACNYGANNAVEMVRKFANRSPLLHIKDGPLVKPESVYNPETNILETRKGAGTSLLPVGSGKNDIAGIVGAMDPAVTEWLVVEQDNSDTDMMECVETSYKFLTGRGLAQGNR